MPVFYRRFLFFWLHEIKRKKTISQTILFVTLCGAVWKWRHLPPHKKEKKRKLTHTHQFTYPTINLSIHPIHLSIHPSNHSSLHPPIYPPNLSTPWQISPRISERTAEERTQVIIFAGWNFVFINCDVIIGKMKHFLIDL